MEPFLDSLTDPTHASSFESWGGTDGVSVPVHGLGGSYPSLMKQSPLEVYEKEKLEQRFSSLETELIYMREVQNTLLDLLSGFGVISHEYLNFSMGQARLRAEQELAVKAEANQEGKVKVQTPKAPESSVFSLVGSD